MNYDESELIEFVGVLPSDQSAEEKEFSARLSSTIIRTAIICPCPFRFIETTSIWT
jgi:hypothetical protein